MIEASKSKVSPTVKSQPKPTITFGCQDPYMKSFPLLCDTILTLGGAKEIIGAWAGAGIWEANDIATAGGGLAACTATECVIAWGLAICGFVDGNTDINAGGVVGTGGCAYIGWLAATGDWTGGGATGAVGVWP